VVKFHRIRWSISAGIAGQFEPEWLVNFTGMRRWNAKREKTWHNELMNCTSYFVVPTIPLKQV
jgi:hypothetical protein